jgi:hypothetical protein
MSSLTPVRSASRRTGERRAGQAGAAPRSCAPKLRHSEFLTIQESRLSGCVLCGSHARTMPYVRTARAWRVGLARGAAP